MFEAIKYMTLEAWIAYAQIGAALVAAGTAITAFFAVRNWRHEHIGKRQIAMLQKAMLLSRQCERLYFKIAYSSHMEYFIPNTEPQDPLLQDITKEIKLVNHKHNILLKNHNGILENVENYKEIYNSLNLYNQANPFSQISLCFDSLDKHLFKIYIKLNTLKLEYQQGRLKTEKATELLQDIIHLHTDEMCIITFNNQALNARDVFYNIRTTTAELLRKEYTASSRYQQFINWLNCTSDDLQKPHKCFFCKQEKHSQDCNRN